MSTISIYPLEGEMKDYKILITKIDNSSHNLNKGMEIKIVDEELLEKTSLQINRPESLLLLL